VFGAGGGTSSYREAEETDLIVLWGSNARDAHPIFFHHILRGVRSGAKLIVVDPRRSSSAEFADLWLGIDVGSDIALANAVAREIIAAGLENSEFIERATVGFDAYADAVDEWTLDRAEKVTGVPATAIRELAHTYAQASTAQLCWTLGITEHHNGTDNVFSLINLALLTGHVGRWGSGLVPVRGQNNVQGGGDMGALPNKLPGFKDVTDDVERARFEAVYGTSLPAQIGWHISQMFDAMERGHLRSVYAIGENPAQSEADAARARRLLGGLDHLVVQDMFLTKTAQLADVVLPAAAGWAETDGTFTSSERRIQLVRRAVDPPGEAHDDLVIIADLAARLGHDWGHPTAEELWDELRSLSAIHAGMSYERLAEHGGLQWPCLDENDPGAPFLHGRLWDDPITGPPAPFTPVEWVSPVDELDAEYPIRLTTGRRLDSYNTGVQSGRFSSPKRWGESIDLSPEDAAAHDLADGDIARVVSRRGSVEAPVRTDSNLRPGLAFMTFHFPDQVDTNLLTKDAWDPKSGTSEYKATAVRIEQGGERR
jgi:predicted molibdopterin-dependent oxidoreductase YjgC